MEIAIGLMALAVTILGIILGFMWRTNGRYMRALTEGMRVLSEGQVQIVRGIERVSQTVERVSQIAERVDQRQVEMAKALQWISEYLVGRREGS